MSTRRGDDSRPKGNPTSQRATARDVPLAKYKEVLIGTSPPGALRGPSLLPGQGAPERIVPEDIELAVLRDAETLDGPNVARAAARRPSEASASPSPTPVSVEVPRARSAPPVDDRFSTPPLPSARSIQSGTLMSIGSVDPRAPTELSLPSPRPLSVSDRAAYFGPEAVVDRVVAPSLEPEPMPAGVTVPPGLRTSLGPESVPPPARDFSRAPRSDKARSGSPVSPPVSSAEPAPEARSRRGHSGPPSVPELGTQLQIHSEISALRHPPAEDNFDLRSANTLREPLARRKAQPSSGRLDVPAATSEPPSLEARSPSIRSSTAAITLLVDRARAESRSEAVPGGRTAVSWGWWLVALLALLVALIAVWVTRAPVGSDTAPVPDDRASASAPSATPLVVPPTPHAPAPQPSTRTPLSRLAPPSSRSAALGAKSPPAVGARSADPLPRGAAPPPSVPADASSKSHQSIY